MQPWRICANNWLIELIIWAICSSQESATHMQKHIKSQQNHEHISCGIPFGVCISRAPVVKTTPRDFHIPECLLHHTNPNHGPLHEYHYTTMCHSTPGAKLQHVHVGTHYGYKLLYTIFATSTVIVWNLYFWFAFLFEHHTLENIVLGALWYTVYSMNYVHGPRV